MRTFDAELVNAIANSPGVPQLLGAEAFDFTDAIANESNIFLHLNGGLGIFDWSAPGVYQGHLLFGPECRGRRAVRVAGEMRDWMFASGARMLWAQPPRANCAVIKLLRLLGFASAGLGENQMVGPVEYVTCHRS